MRDLHTTTLTNVGIAASNVVTGLLLARLLGPDGRGVLTAIISWPMLLAAVATMGMPHAVVYFSARERDDAGVVLGTALVVGLIGGLPLLFIGWLMLPSLLSAYPEDTVTIARIYLLAIPIGSTLAIANRPLRGIGEWPTWNVLRTLPTVAWVMVVGSAVLFQLQSVSAIAIAFLCTRALLIIPTVWFVSRKVAQPVKPVASRVKSLMAFGLPSIAAEIPQVLNFRLDQLLLIGIVDSRDLGLYVAAAAWASISQPVLTAIGTVLFPKVAQKTETGGQVALLQVGIRAGVVVATFLSALLTVAAPLMVPVLFGPEFHGAVSASMILSGASGLHYLNRLVEEGVRGLGHPKGAMTAESIGLIFTVAALWPASAAYGIIGAAVVSIIGYAITTAVLIIVLRRRVSLKGKEWLPTRREYRLMLRSVHELLQSIRQPRASRS